MVFGAVCSLTSFVIYSRCQAGHLNFATAAGLEMAQKETVMRMSMLSEVVSFIAPVVQKYHRITLEA